MFEGITQIMFGERDGKGVERRGKRERERRRKEGRKKEKGRKGDKQERKRS